LRVVRRLLAPVAAAAVLAASPSAAAAPSLERTTTSYATIGGDPQVGVEDGAEGALPDRNVELLVADMRRASR